MNSSSLQLYNNLLQIVSNVERLFAINESLNAHVDPDSIHNKLFSHH